MLSCYEMFPDEEESQIAKTGKGLNFFSSLVHRAILDGTNLSIGRAVKGILGKRNLEAF